MFQMTIITPNGAEYINNPQKFWVQDCYPRGAASQLCVKCDGYSKYVLYEYHYRESLYDMAHKLINALHEGLLAGKDSIIVSIR